MLKMTTIIANMDIAMDIIMRRTLKEGNNSMLQKEKEKLLQAEQPILLADITLLCLL